MFTQISQIITRAPSAVIEDMIGVMAIFVVLLVGLSLPGMV